VSDHPDSVLANFARERLTQMASAEAARQDTAARAGFEGELSAWQRVEAVQGTGAEPLALAAFLAAHPTGEFADKARGRLQSLPARPSPAAEDAADLVWPLVDASGRPQDLVRFAALFPERPEAEAARARATLAEM